MQPHTLNFLTAVTLFLFIAGCATKSPPPREGPVPPGPSASPNQSTQPSAPAPAPTNTAITIGQKFALESKILKERRSYWVHLPESYHDKTYAPKRYPVLYLLDGDANFHSTSGIVQFMSGPVNANIQIPELIIVAIPNTQRTRDLTPTRSLKSTRGKDLPNLASSGGAEAFLDFIRDELIPHIESQYRTAPYRILVGHSFGGLFAINALFRQPPIFNSYISIDPSLWWNDQVLLRRAKTRLQQNNDFKGAIYVTLANNYPSTEDWDADLAANAVRDLVETLKTNKSDAFRIAMQYHDSEDHVSVPLLSLYQGLLFIFDGYKPSATTVEDPTLISGHFEKVSKRLGFQILPPEQFVSDWGHAMYYWNRDTNKALQWLTMNVTNYPNSFIGYDSLGFIYAQTGNKELAIKNYQKALDLNPTHRRAAEQIRRLKGFSDDGPLTNGVYKLINRKSDKALEVAGASQTNSAEIIQARYTGGLHQQWNLKAQGDGYYQITAAHSGKALAISQEDADTQGAKLLQRPVHGRAHQIWRIVPNDDGTWRLLNEHNGLAIQTTDRPNVIQSPWQSLPHQKWSIHLVK